MNESQINSLKDLNKFRTAPVLSNLQVKELFKELTLYLELSDWFTVGIMALDQKLALDTLRQMETCLKWSPMKLKTKSNLEGPVFLKANQHTGYIYIRTEHGLGTGILISCQHYDDSDAKTFGPFPLDFFDYKK